MSFAGKLLYHAWHAPVARGRDIFSRGLLDSYRTAAGRRAMTRAANTLPLLPISNAAPVRLHLLTGRNYWYQTAFCLWTFARHARRPLEPFILDDGSLEEEHRSALRRLFPSTQFSSGREILERLDTSLPAARFPTLRARRLEFPLLRKLTDVHAGLSGWRLFLDSDLLFFHSPTFLLSWHDTPSRPLRGEDLENAYGYSLDLLAELAGKAVPERVNTGTLGLRSEAIDWARLEFWCRELQTRVGPHYYQEQALVALLLAGTECDVPPPADHVICPESPEALACRAAMHHYVADSKRWYFQRNWRHAVSSPS